MRGVSQTENPFGVPTFRSVIRVAPRSSSQVYVVSMGNGGPDVRIVSRLSGTYSMISYVYANRRPRKCATKSIREPTYTGRGVFHSTDLMFRYHRGALSGSAAYRETSSTARLMTTVFNTSTVMAISHHKLIETADDWLRRSVQ
jgi:hypothetical protein